MRKKYFHLISLVALALVGLTACAKKFDHLLLKATQAFTQQQYVETVDATNAALMRWRESDGPDKKAQAYQLLGKAYHQLKKLDQAEEAFREATKLSDQTYDSAYALGTIYLLKKDFKKAGAAFQTALRMKKDDPLALLGLGDCFYFTGQYEQAKNFYQSVLDLSPGVRNALTNLSLVNQKLKTSDPRAFHKWPNRHKKQAPAGKESRPKRNY